MTGYTVHTGSTEGFSSGWDRIFGGGAAKDESHGQRKATQTKKSKKKTGKKQTLSVKSGKGKKAAKKKSAKNKSR